MLKISLGLITLLSFISSSVALTCKSEEHGCGGFVSSFQEFIDSYNIKTYDAKGNPIPPQYKLPDYCISACVMLLAIRNSCVTQNTILSFHSARNILYEYDGGYDPPKSISGPANNLIRDYLPPKIQEWADQHHVFDSLIFTSLVGSDAIRLGVRECK